MTAKCKGIIKTTVFRRRKKKAYVPLKLFPKGFFSWVGYGNELKGRRLYRGYSEARKNALLKSYLEVKSNI